MTTGRLAATRPAWSAGLVWLAAAVGLVGLRHAVGDATTRFASALPSNPWFVPDHALLLYVAVPLAVVSAGVVLLAPGLFLQLAFGRETRFSALLVKGFVTSFGLHFVLGILLLLVQGTKTPAGFLAVTLGAGLGAWLVLAWRVAMGQTARMPHLAPGEGWATAWLVAIPWLTVVLLFPVIFWQDINADGFEAMEMGRALMTHVMPRWPNGSGVMGLGIGMVPMAFGVHWFQMLFGTVEASTRLPLTLYLPLLFGAMIALIELRRPRGLRPAELAVLVLALAVFTVAQSFNASYDSYYADIASPTAFETLTPLLFVAAAYFLWNDEHGWFVLLAVLSYLARPTGLLLVLLLGASIAVTAPERRRRTLVLVAGAAALWAVLLVGYEFIYVKAVAIGHGRPSYPSRGIIGRFQYLTFGDWHRLAYAFVPAGLLPAAALLAWRRQDAMTRSLTLTCLGYLAVFFLPAFTAHHHFVPVAIFSIVILWRLILGWTDRLLPAGLTALAAVVALGLSLPRHFLVNRTMREIGQVTSHRIGDYHGDWSAYRQAIEAEDLIYDLFPGEWQVDDPDQVQVGGGQLLYYAAAPKRPGTMLNYIIQPGSAPAPTGFTRLDSTAIGTVWVRDSSLWARQRRPRYPSAYRSPTLDISRETLFYFLGSRTGHYDINLGTVRGLWRLF